MTAAPSTLAMPPPPRTAGPTVAVSAIPPPARTPIQFDWITTYWQLRDLAHHFLAIGPGIAYLDFRDAATSMSNSVSYRLKKFGENTQNLHPLPGDVTKSEQAYRALEGMSRRAVESGDTERAYLIRQELDILNQLVTSKLEELTRKYGALDALSTQATQATRATRATRAEAPVQSAPTRIGPKTSAALPVTFMPPVTGGAAQVPVSALDPGSVVNLAQVPGTPGQPLPSSLPGPSLSEAGGTEVGSPGHWRLDPPASAPGTTAAHPVAAEAIVTPSLSGTSSFWLQPVDSVPATGSVPFGSGLHHAGETVRPPPATTTESSAAPAPGAVFRLPSWGGRQLRRRARPPRRPAPPRVRCVAAQRPDRIVPRVRARQGPCSGPAPHTDHRQFDVCIPGNRCGGPQQALHRVSPLPEGEHRARGARCVSGASRHAVARPGAEAGGAAPAR